MDFSGSQDDALGLGKLFSDPNLIGKLASNPKTQKHLADPTFVQKVRTYSLPSTLTRFITTTCTDKNGSTKSRAG
jgi:hypothetical protein